MKSLHGPIAEVFPLRPLKAFVKWRTICHDLNGNLRVQWNRQMLRFLKNITRGRSCLCHLETRLREMTLYGKILLRARSISREQKWHSYALIQSSNPTDFAPVNNSFSDVHMLPWNMCEKKTRFFIFARACAKRRYSISAAPIVVVQQSMMGYCNGSGHRHNKFGVWNILTCRCVHVNFR